MIHLPTTPERSRRMREIAQAETAAEQRIRQILREFGASYRINVQGLPGRPDIANASRRRAIFVNGCFWHGHVGCSRSRIPHRNSGFWLAKLRANRDRDRRKLAEIRALGFEPLVVWECELDDEAALRERLHAYWFHASPNGSGTRRPRAPDSSSRVTQVHPQLVEEFACLPGEPIAYRWVARRDGSLSRTSIPRADSTHNLKDAASIFEASWLRSVERPLVPQDAEIVRVADLFSGCGAMTLGVEEAARALGMSTRAVLAADLDASARRVYAHNFQEASVLDAPIETVVGGRLGVPASSSEEQLVSDFGKLDVLVAGPPCQGHSDLNNHTRRHDPKNALAFRVVRVAELVRPRHVIIENVRGILHDRGSVFGRVRAALERLGYSVDSITAKCEKLGVAQRRHRVILAASLEHDVDLKSWLLQFETTPRSVSWAISDLYGNSGETVFDSASRPVQRNKRRIDYLFDEDLYDLPDVERPECHRNGGHSYKSVYGRIRPGEPAQTVTTGFGCMGQGRFVHPKERRTITPHEAARLQFIPDFFDFGDAKRTSLARLIGNAVPPKLIYAIALSMLR